MIDGIIHGDCLAVMSNMPADSVDLIVTSPPYADRRKKQYGGLPADKYVGWFMPMAAEMARILKLHGSLVINIKEHVIDGERSEYVMDLIRTMRISDWNWIDDYIWHKTNPTPGKWPSRLKDGWEHCLHFSRTLKPKLYSKSMREPSDRKTIERYAKAKDGGMVKTDADGTVTYREKHRSMIIGSGFNYQPGGFVTTTALPSNVLHFPSECGRVGHPAPFPLHLPTFFIRLFTQAGDTVLDPFCGSGTTLLAAAKLGRKYVGIDTSAEYCNVARRRVDAPQQMLEDTA